MKSTIRPALATLLLLTVAPLAGCAAPDGAAGVPDDGVGESEDVAVAESALSGGDLGAFFANRQNKPAISIDRGVGTIPSVCPSGQTEIAGTCWPSLTGASCPAGKEMDTGLCYPVCPLGYEGVGPVCWIDSIGEEACAQLYDAGIAAGALAAHRARTFGVGVELDAGASVGWETGVYYGENGEYGCYTSSCSGAVTDIGVSAYVTFGDFTGVSALTGDGVDLSAGVGYGAAGFSESISLDENGNVVGFVQQVSLGAGVSPIALGASSCDTELTMLAGPGPHVADAPDGSPGNTFYRVAPDGTLQMSHQQANGTFDVINRNIGWGWGGQSKIFAAEGGHVYAIDGQGTLRHYHHDGAGDWDDWGTEFGWGWGGFTKVFAGRFGEIYAIDASGDLRLYRHDASLQFYGYSGTVIGSGWGFPVVFSGGHGALYAVDGNGNLLYYYHDDNGAWVLAGLQIGTGWDVFSTLGSTGNGEIYAVLPNGDLLFYRHDVDKVWLAGSGAQIGWGWQFDSHGLIPASY